ncbi:MAG TPA: MFS transporter [Ktedonobacteraceae bacterium]|jgi:hypothetical protein
MYQEQDETYEQEYAPAMSQVHGKKAVYTVLYFAIMAILMVPATALHAGMPGVLAAMAVAGLIMFAGWLIIRHYRRKLASMGLSWKQWFFILMGFTPSTRTAQPFKVVNADGSPLKDESLNNTMSRAVAVRDLNSPDAVIADCPDEHGRPTRFIQNEPICLAESFQPSIHSVLGQSILMIGKRRSGKSNGMSVFFEELARYAIPFVLFDTEGEYDGLVAPRYLPRGILVCHEDMAATLEREHGSDGARIITASVEGAFELGRAIMDGELQTVVNLASYDDEEASLIMVEMIEGIYKWEQERRNDQRIPVIVGLDEAAKWFPQNAKSPVSRDATAMLQRAFFDVIVGRGGKRGFGLIASTLKYAIIDKRLLQSNWKLLFSETEDIELAQYEKWGIAREETLSLQQGECFIFNHLVIGFRLQIRKKYSPDLSTTPGLKNLISHSRNAAPVHSVLRRSYTGTKEQTAFLTAPDVEDREEETRATVPASPSPAPQQNDLERAVDAYAKGATSIDKLAAALDCSPWRARQLMSQVKTQKAEQQEQPPSEN